MYWFGMDEQGTDRCMYLNCMYLNDQLASHYGTPCHHFCLSHLVTTVDWNFHPSVVEGPERRLKTFVLECPGKQFVYLTKVICEV